MVYYRHLLSDASDMQRAILASGLANTQGKPMSFKPIDQNQEHINLQIATSFRNYKNSTHDEDIVLDRLSLTANVVGICRSNIDKVFGQVIDGKHCVDMG
jgi:hypothetical protein